MGADTIEAVLTQFGIKSTLNGEGKFIRTIDVVSTQPECQPKTAYFDENLSEWRFGNYSLENGRLTDSRSRDAALTTKVDRPNTPPISSLAGDEWTQLLPPSAHTDFVRSCDWAATSLGSCDTWPYTLRLYTHMLLADTRAGAICWGEEQIAIYNQHFIPLMGPLHPSSMGGLMEIAIPTTSRFFDSMIEAVNRDQTGLEQRNVEVPTERHGYLEESWWDASVIPLKGDRGEAGGVYFSWVEVTRTVLRDRATALLNRLGQSSRIEGSHVWQHIHETFVEYPRDIPMAIMYGVDKSGSNEDLIHLKYTIGPENTYKAAPASINLAATDDRSVLAPLFTRARKSTSGFVILDLAQNGVHSEIIENIEWAGYKEPSTHIVVVALQARQKIEGYILLGLNPRRSLNSDHKQFISDLVQQLKDIMTRIIAEDEAHTREQHLMEALMAQKQVRRIAEIAPAGIYEMGASGTILWANSHFFDILGVAPSKRDVSMIDWREYIHPEDVPKAFAMLGRIVQEKVEISDNLRLIRSWKPPSSLHGPQLEDEPYWILYSATPELDDDGSLRSLTGCLTNISQLKWAEQLQIRTAEAAVRDKQRHEEFIDITSHELRNPLSAITQCADSIIESLQEVKNTADPRSLVAVVEHNAEAAESIAFCAAHQRRIIDDVLALGKLDSGLLAITSAAFRPQSLIDEAVQMFKGEFATNEIEMTTMVDEDSILRSTSLANGDSARLMQILVNLLTNAIKFTRTQKTRMITIRFGSSYSVPKADLFGPGFRWHATERDWPDLTQEPSYGPGRPIYLYYGVIDTGTGIAGESTHKVFSKFEQADRRTYINYGGSGLGLYISRKLTEIQGGRIGVESKETVGSTFAFYTKAKCAPNQASVHDDATGRRQTSITQVTDESRTLGQRNEPSHTATGNAPQPSARPSGPYNILLVEDNIINQNVLAKQLKKVGCTVHKANHGGEAIDFMLHLAGQPSEYGTSSLPNAPGRIDCVLMDWEMPVCSGLTATKRIREIEKQQKIAENTIIGITANARREQISEAIEAGMDGVVTKPFRVPDLLLKISELVRSKKKQTPWTANERLT